MTFKNEDWKEIKMALPRNVMYKYTGNDWIRKSPFTTTSVIDSGKNQ